MLWIPCRHSRLMKDERKVSDVSGLRRPGGLPVWSPPECGLVDATGDLVTETLVKLEIQSAAVPASPRPAELISNMFPAPCGAALGTVVAQTPLALPLLHIQTTR